MIGRVTGPLKQFALPLLCAAMAACGADAPPAAGLDAARERLFTESFERRGIDAPYVYEAFRRVPRAAFLPDDLEGRAWEDRAFRRPDGETVTAPYLSAVMLQYLELDPSSRVLECGTRTGWFTALLAASAEEVVTIDAREDFTAGAREALFGLGLTNVRYVTADPLVPPEGDPPFDAILVNGTVRHIPLPLYRALKPGGRILAPVGENAEVQTLIRSIRGEGEPKETRAVISVRFGPLRR
jgi:protein-L-isoaspartate(D-aspartate) O-methyltransferase